jgi:hypothetical protein
MRHPNDSACDRGDFVVRQNRQAALAGNADHHDVSSVIAQPSWAGGECRDDRGAAVGFRTSGPIFWGTCPAILADYHVPVHADIPDIDVIFVNEPDLEVSSLGVKGVGEIGVVGTAAAVANAIFHATGKRVCSLPITIDKLLD